MKSRFTIFFILLAAVATNAQPGLNNGSFDQWRGGEVLPGHGAGTGGEKCCGVALAVPVWWGIPEQLMQMATNHFTIKETDTANIHSGYFSAQLYTDTTTLDSAGDVRDNIGVLVPGVVTCAGIVGYGGLGMTGDLYQTIAYSVGYPFSDSPVALHFYMKFEHAVTDTARYAYAFTRWDSVSMKEDTLAVNDVEIPDNDAYPWNQWIMFTDSIHYILPGAPDTLHLIFFGGKNGDPNKAGNITWLDDVSFDTITGTNDTTGSDTTAAAIAGLTGIEAVYVYPNPASNVLNVKMAQLPNDAVIEIYTLTGDRLIRQGITGAVSSYNIAQLPDGVYFYRIMDKNSNGLYNGRFTVLH